mgnify:CR=1 FL=1
MSYKLFRVLLDYTLTKGIKTLCLVHHQHDNYVLLDYTLTKGIKTRSS